MYERGHMFYLTTKIGFSAYHRLWNHSFSDQENTEIYQECSRGHGHNYILEVTVKGEANATTGIVMDLKRLNRLLMTEIFPWVDHKNLNDDVPFLKGKIPTAELVSACCWDILKDKIKDAKLYRLKLFESEKNIVEYYGD